MDAPICRLCKTKHWSRAPCPAATAVMEKMSRRNRAALMKAFPGAKPKSYGRAVGLVLSDADAKLPASQQAAIVMNAASMAPKKQGWDREKYNAYQREYMRKIRARKARMLKSRAARRKRARASR